MLVHCGAHVSVNARYDSQSLHASDVVRRCMYVSGDDETYPVPVYKARVTETLKGVTQGSQLLFEGAQEYPSDETIFSSYQGVGSHSEQIGPSDRYGQISSLYRIMYAGYSVMEIDYACVLDGIEPWDRCQYAAKLNPEQILLPKRCERFLREMQVR